MFLLDCEARRLTPATREFYRAKLAIFVRWCAEEHIENLNELTAHDIRRFLVHILRRGLSGQYQHNLARAIRAFLNYCVRDALLESSPIAQVQMPWMERKVPEALSAHEFNAILRSRDCARDRAICLFLLDSGVRASELPALNLGDVDLKSGAMTVRLGKGQKGRTTYVGAATRKQLRRYYTERTTTRDDDPVFIAEKGRGRLTQGGLVQLMERLRKRSGVALRTCHTFRRTFVITCLRNGMNLYMLARLMGHADITVLRPYLALVEDDLQDAHTCYGAVDRMLR